MNKLILLALVLLPCQAFSVTQQKLTKKELIDLNAMSIRQKVATLEQNQSILYSTYILTQHNQKNLNEKALETLKRLKLIDKNYDNLPK